MMLQIFKDQPYLQNEKPNLYFSLISTKDSDHDSNYIPALRSTMNKNHKALLQVITKLNDRFFVLEQTCKPPSRKRHQDNHDLGNPEGERRSKRLRQTTITSSSSQQTSTTSRSRRQPTKSRSSETQRDQEVAASHESSEAEREEESGSVSAMGEKDKDAGKSKVNEPTTMPMVEKPKAFSFSHFATGITSHVTDELNGKILMDA